MAIQSLEKVKLKNKTIPSSSKSSNLSSTKLMKFECGANGNISSNNSEYDTKENKNVSPYLTGDRIHLLSRITEKKFLHKRTADYMSSFPLAVNIYKANSDQFRLSKKRTKKVKKSVLTLPNEQVPLPQVCTVSDMNDSECFNNDNDHENMQKSKRKRPVKTRKPLHSRIRIYDRDLKYCSQLNIDLDKSSTDIINTGDGKKVAKKYRPKSKKNLCGLDKSNFNPHDVWSVIRNVDEFQFRTTPSLSQESVSVKKRKSLNRRQNKQGDARFVETCRTEEFAYISSFTDHPLHNANSQSSVDRITVIDKNDDFQKMCRNIDKEMRKPHVIRTEKYSCQNNKAKLKKKGRKQSDKIILEDKICDRRINSESEMTFKGNLNIEAIENKKTKPSNTSTFSNKILYENCNDNILHFGIGGSYEKQSNTSDHSGLISGTGSLTEVRSISHKLTSKDPEQVTGITKVVLSKGQKILLTKQIEAAKRKSRLSSPLYNDLKLPKMTHTEIKRRLACLRFPLIILGKDQLSSAVEIQRCGSPQFDGLDEHIWPFMKNWVCKDYNFFENDIKGENIEIECSNSKHDIITHSTDTNKQSRNSGNMDYTNVKPMLKHTYNENIQAIKAKKDNVKQLVVQKERPMRKVKDKMLQLIRKKSVSKCSIKANDNTNRHVTEARLPRDIADVSTNTRNELIDELEKREEKNVRRNSLNKSYQWAKKKWASEFIDNVIRKIKNGVYFYHDDKNYLRKSYRKREEFVQTEVIVKQNCVQDTQVMTKDIDVVTAIPGFDNRLTDLEIETVQSYNQISVKHCITNLVIQFDVALTRDNNCMQIKKSFSFIPVKETENPKIFKCKSAIANAILPAEICSILPDLMRKIIDANSKLVYPALTVDKIESHLPAITEITRSENDDAVKQLFLFSIDLSARVKALYQGKFREIKSENKIIEKIRFYKQRTIHHAEAQQILSKININLSCTGIVNQSTLIYNLFSLTKPVFKNKDLKDVKLKPICMALEPYLESKRKVYPAFEKFNFKTFVESLLSNRYLHVYINAPSLNNLKFCNNVSVSIEADDVEEIGKATYTITNLTINAIYNEFKERCNTENNAINYFNDKNNFETNKKCIDKRKTRAEFSVNSHKNRKRGFVKLYKKCKSMSSLPNERSSTSLNKITNLDEFFIALGSAKTLASVFDGNIERKILSSIREMKNWMTEITPRQALLVLLLANKKDTSNLVRYHSIILQGIAVNRITRATELDMEIEVIETENINIRSKYDGITYLTASVENQDTLLEELCWIAKTTASDYHKTFDESSERHLKFLLEKRKKLNPSYLRVMARYVGLGLLKYSK